MAELMVLAVVADDDRLTSVIPALDYDQTHLDYISPSQAEHAMTRIL